MSTPGAQGRPDYESATNLSPNQATSISSQSLPPPHSYLPPPSSSPPPRPQRPSEQQPLTLPDMTSLSSVPRMDQPEGLLPAFPSRSYSHLPTPQSPNNITRYVGDNPHTPQSPLPNAPQHPTTSSSYQRLAVQNKYTEDTPTRNHGSKQCITPESSPTHNSRSTPPPRIGFQVTPSIRSNKNDTGVLTPKHGKPAIALELTTSASSPLAPSPHISSPLSATSEHSSHFSSPFINKLSMADRERLARRKQTFSAPASPIPMDVDDVFSSPAYVRSRLVRHQHQGMMDVSASPVPLPPQASTSATIAAGGEIERIRQALIEDRLAKIREAESRRPEYLKRSKRPLSDVDSSIFTDDKEQDRGFAVGITESPNKGRRLKLFQETSEESFEESLMAGGYGRYRTNDWVRQPQPLSFLGSNNAGTPNVAEMLIERVEEAPPSEKELKKRKRLEAFRSSAKSRPKLTPVDLVGKGRVLLEMPSEDRPAVPETPESTPSKRRSAGSKRKRKSSDLTPGKDRLQPVEELDGPNWPDDEFPWRLRKEERNEAEKAKEDERLKWIEKFLDRDTDDEDENEETSKVAAMNDDEEILPSAKWGLVYEDEADKPVPARMGRGKMVPLLAHPEDPRRAYAKKKSVFPSDPADARAVLLAKKSVRALAYRNQRRQRELAEEGNEDAVICICNGRDDGRELVQCDGCQTWYHLQCIGIRNIAALGREEDAWFCRSCVTRVRSPSPVRDPQPTILREPTFVPTDDAPRIRRTQDPTLYQPLHNSPLWNPPRAPKTPTRGGGRLSDFDLSSSSDSSKLPSTPQNPSHDIRLYNTPGPLEHHPLSANDDPPFDPNSTPSRGIKFGAFATPKSNPWSIRAGGLFHTPSRHHSRNSFGRSFGSLEDMGGSFGAFDGLTRYPNVEDSPIRRTMAGEGPRVKKVPQSPLLSKSLVPLRPAPPVPEESPVVRLQSQRDVARLPGMPPSREDGVYMR